MASEDITSLVGCDVRRVSFDFQVRLLLGDGPHPGERVAAELVIEAPFCYSDAAGVTYKVRPGDIETVKATANLFRQTIETAEFDGRALNLEFDDGSRINVETGSTYESWSLNGHGVPDIVAGPRYLNDDGKAT